MHLTFRISYNVALNFTDIKKPANAGFSLRLSPLYLRAYHHEFFAKSHPFDDHIYAS